ncbi:hypothetical protein ACHWQZ_G019327 [Mnemiopsis leidyi]
MWKLERASVYVDLRITLPTYSRFDDDRNGTTSNSRKAQQLCNLIEQQDPDKLIKLTLDFPSSCNEYIPFLNTEVRIDDEGKIHSRVIEAIKDKRKRQRKRHKTQTSDNTAILKLPYINEATSRKFRDAVKHSELTVKIVEKPGRRLKDLLTDSRPLDKAKCTNKNCRTCESLSPSLDNGDCMSRNTIYKITCTLDNCLETYGGKTYRPLYHRFDEHYRSAANPTAKSYVDKPLAKHYRDKHPKHNGNPQLKLLSL